MPNTHTEFIDGETCAVPLDGPAGSRTAGDGGLLSGGCCAGGDGSLAESRPMGRGARRARAAAGVGFLALAGAMSSRQLPGRTSLWPAAIVPIWFGVSHLVASVTGYPGCPELGAIPSVLLDRPVATGCGTWERIDRWIDGSSPPGSSSSC
jgi:hypothetical protein